MHRPDGWWERTRRGITMTSVQFDVLLRLRDAKESGFPFISLDDVWKTVPRTLFERDWIFASPGKDGLKYKITTRGEKALKLFEQPPRRFDGICPTCNIRPKLVSVTGRVYGYCKECERKYKKFRNDRNLNRINPDRLCSQCHQRPLHRYSGGRLSTYCTECRHAQRKAEKRAQHDRDLARIRNGEVLLCRVCKKEPRAYTERYVRDRCPACQKQYMDEYNARRRAKV